MGEPAQITLIPPNGITTSSAPSANFRISAHPTLVNGTREHAHCQEYVRQNTSDTAVVR
jgi:hypothetical protein